MYHPMPCSFAKTSIWQKFMIKLEGHNFLLWDQWDSIIFKFAIIRFHHFGQENTLQLAGTAQSYPRDRNFKTDDTHTASTFDVAEAERQVFARSIYQWQQEYGDETRKSRGERRLSRLSDEGGISSRSLEFEVEQRERKALFSQKEEKQHVAFREAQEARWRCFTNGEAERERTFSTAEHERNLSALEDERQREVLLQVKLEDLRRRSIERGQQLLSNIDTWGSEPLKERESTETMQFQLEEGQRMLNFRCLFI